MPRRNRDAIRTRAPCQADPSGARAGHSDARRWLWPLSLSDRRRQTLHQLATILSTNPPTERHGGRWTRPATTRAPRRPAPARDPMTPCPGALLGPRLRDLAGKPHRRNLTQRECAHVGAIKSGKVARMQVGPSTRAPARPPRNARSGECKLKVREGAREIRPGWAAVGGDGLPAACQPAVVPTRDTEMGREFPTGQICSGLGGLQPENGERLVGGSTRATTEKVLVPAPIKRSQCCNLG